LLETAPSEALRVAREGHREFGHDSLLGEEREAIIVFALLALNRGVEAERAGRVFLQRHPGGPFSEEVRTRIEEHASP
jgi:hypothetical protein